MLRERNLSFFMNILVYVFQILNYLRSHAHPTMLQKPPTVPPTITDQVRLWELERDRLSFTEGVMYNQFLSQSDFEMLRDYAKVREIFF